MTQFKIKKKPSFKILIQDKPIDRVFNETKRTYINSQIPFKGEHIFEFIDVYFTNVPDSIKCATNKGIEDLLKATNMKGLIIPKYIELTNNDVDAFFNKLGVSRNTEGYIINNFLSMYGNKKKAYQLLVGNFNLEGLNGSTIGSAAIVNNYGREYLHQILVAHELGHIFKAAENSNRTNVLDQIGLHCFNNKTKYSENCKIIEITPCVMRQDFGEAHLNSLIKVGAIYCPDCVKDMKYYIKNDDIRKE